MSLRSRIFLTCLISATVVAVVEAHPLAPSLLELVEAETGEVEVRWKTPAAGVPGADLRPLLPEDCAVATSPVVSRAETALVARWTLDCRAAGLVGRTIAATGLEESRTSVLLRIALADGRSFRAVLGPEQPSFVVPERQSSREVAVGYLWLGVEHILTGPDHLLFVLGLLLLIAGRWQLVRTLTAFTLGHSVTLALAVLGFVHVPQAPAEAAIALSILVLALELTRENPPAPTWIRKWPWAMAAGFGLLHGLGFAGALAEIGLPAGDVPLALLSFNVGIEAGQVLFVAGVLALRLALRALAVRWPARMSLVPAYVIGSLAAFWLFERIALVIGVRFV